MIYFDLENNTVRNVKNFDNVNDFVFLGNNIDLNRSHNIFYI